MVHDPEVVFAAACANVQVCCHASVLVACLILLIKGCQRFRVLAGKPGPLYCIPQVGYMDDPPNVPGLAHFLEHAVHLVSKSGGAGSLIMGNAPLMHTKHAHACFSGTSGFALAG